MYGKRKGSERSRGVRRVSTGDPTVGDLPGMVGPHGVVAQRIASDQEVGVPTARAEYRVQARTRRAHAKRGPVRKHVDGGMDGLLSASDSAGDLQPIPLHLHRLLRLDGPR